MIFKRTEKKLKVNWLLLAIVFVNLLNGYKHAVDGNYVLLISTFILLIILFLVYLRNKGKTKDVLHSVINIKKMEEK